MIPKNTKSFLREFRSSRGQSEEIPKQVEPPTRKRNTSTVTPYEVFLKKYNDLENCIERLSNRDLVYYFREIAQEQGYKYVISNMQKDMAIMKRLKTNYEIAEICGMIEFLYESEQDYLKKDRLSPNVLASGWVNTIYADMKLWVDDKYIPQSKSKSQSNKKLNEWDKNTANINNDVSIGIKL